MQTSKVHIIIITILASSLVFGSCEKREHTTQKVLVGNNSLNDIIVEFNTLADTADTIFSDCMTNTERACRVTLISEGFMDEILPKFTDDEFEERISSLKVYYYDAENRKVNYGGSSEFCKKMENWEYHYSEDDKYGLHEYKLVAVD